MEQSMKFSVIMPQNDMVDPELSDLLNIAPTKRSNERQRGMNL